ncbi:hypothetical protein F2Q68_00015460 [Brassica cretica]|uniref:Uncharacterized protein n=2 Tax=Brassica cretica TaxID=69181 RepID=A0A8S9HRA0_BRACR|nr:hypothetical protein F2Q68_00015460 [Brassica cretica]KAF3610099.1 hypothetical protein DY000_02048090 [Brassica cretica]
MNSDLPVSLVGGRVRPCRLFTDPFSSPVASFGEVSETDSEVIPRAPLKQCGSLVLDDGQCSEIQEGGFQGIVPSLVAEVSSVLGFCPSQIIPSSWKTLMSIQVLGELYGIDTGVHEDLYSYYFTPLMIMHGFYHLQPRDGAPLVEEPSRGTWASYPFGDNWTSRCVSSGILSWGSRGEKDVGDSSMFPWSALPDEQGSLALQSALGFFSNWHMTITSCLLALFLRLSCEKHMKGLEYLQVKERTAACAESAEAAGQLSPLSLALS